MCQRVCFKLKRSARTAKHIQVVFKDVKLPWSFQERGPHARMDVCCVSSGPSSPPATEEDLLLLFKGLTQVGVRATGLRDRMAIRFAMKALGKTVPASFIELSVDREPVSALTKALRASSETLTTLVLSADACHSIARCSPEKALLLEGAVRGLALSVRVTIAGAVTSREKNPFYDPAPLALWMPSLFPDVNASEYVIRAALLILRSNTLASVRLPPIDLLSGNLKVQSWWTPRMDLMSSNPTRLHFSDLLLDFFVLYAQISKVEDGDDGGDSDGDEDDMIDLSAEGVKNNAEQLVNAFLPLHNVETLCVYADNEGFVIPPRFLRTMRISRLQIKETSTLAMDLPECVEYATWIAGNVHILAVGLYRQTIRDEDGDGAPFSFARAMLGNDAHGFPGGVTLFSCAHESDPPSTQPLDDVLGRLRLGTRLCLDLKNVAWQRSTIQAIGRALMLNPDVRHLQLTVLSVLDGVLPLSAWPERILDLPPHVTSADFHMHPSSFSLIFQHGASLPGIEVANVDFMHTNIDYYVGRHGSIALFLRGTPLLRKLALSMSGNRRVAICVGGTIVREAPPGCTAVDFSFYADDDAKWQPKFDEAVSAGRIKWTRKFVPSFRRHIPLQHNPFGETNL